MNDEHLIELGENEMNEVLNQLKNRKSVRVFEERTISKELKQEIIKAALEAPTAGAMMLYSIIDITDNNTKEALSVLCDNQPFIAKAPMVMVFLADYQRWYDTFCYEECNPRTPGTGDILLAMADALIAAQNTVVAAESLGIGSCYIGDIIEQCEDIRELLNLPEYVVPAAMLVYGYPTKSQIERKKPARFEEEYVVYENNYKRLSKEQHEVMYQKREDKAGHPKKDRKESIQAFCKRKYMSDFSLEMNRSAEEYLKNFRK